MQAKIREKKQNKTKTRTERQRCARSAATVTYMEVEAVAVFGLAGTGQVTERLEEGIPPKRHENDDNDPSSSSWKEPQTGDYPVQACPLPPGDWLLPSEIRSKAKIQKPREKPEKKKDPKEFPCWG